MSLEACCKQKAQAFASIINKKKKSGQVVRPMRSISIGRTYRE
jgi:hypothetical protein